MFQAYLFQYGDKTVPTRFKCTESMIKTTKRISGLPLASSLASRPRPRRLTTTRPLRSLKENLLSFSVWEVVIIKRHRLPWPLLNWLRDTFFLCKMKLLTHNVLSSKCLKGVSVGYPLRLNVSCHSPLARACSRVLLNWTTSQLYLNWKLIHVPYCSHNQEFASTLCHTQKGSYCWANIFWISPCNYFFYYFSGYWH